MTLTTMLAAATAIQAGPRLIAFEPGLVFPAANQSAVLLYEGVKPGARFDEVIPSWNVEGAANARVEVELRPSGHAKWYRLANWSLDADKGGRVSVEGQKDETANVLTDTLRLAQPSESLDVRIRVTNLGGGLAPKLKLVTLSFSGPEVGSDAASRSAAWGKVIEVPQRAQGNYPRGSVLCSPTSVSMVLWHYSNVLDRPELNQDVPEVEKGVWDSVYEGAGNWPFNAAYVGSFQGMRSYITRLGSIEDAEKWIAAGYPLICSAPLALLQGEEPTRDTGHLVVLVGFTKDGDPVFNDPAKRDQVRRTYKRADFEKAWKTSRRTVYIVHPEGAKVPAGSNGRWIE